MRAHTRTHARTHTHTHTHPFNGPFPGLPRSARTRKAKPIGILLKHQLGYMQVCASHPYQQPPLSLLSFFTGWMPFLPPNQQCQNTEGKALKASTVYSKQYQVISRYLCLAHYLHRHTPSHICEVPQPCPVMTDTQKYTVSHKTKLLVITMANINPFSI